MGFKGFKVFMLNGILIFKFMIFFSFMQDWSGVLWLLSEETIFLFSFGA